MQLQCGMHVKGHIGMLSTYWHQPKSPAVHPFAWNSHLLSSNGTYTSPSAPSASSMCFSIYPFMISHLWSSSGSPICSCTSQDQILSRTQCTGHLEKEDNYLTKNAQIQPKVEKNTWQKVWQSWLNHILLARSPWDFNCSIGRPWYLRLTGNTLPATKSLPHKQQASPSHLHS